MKVYLVTERVGHVDRVWGIFSSAEKFEEGMKAIQKDHLAKSTGFSKYPAIQAYLKRQLKLDVEVMDMDRVNP